jgi:hypothetical protein
MLGQAAKCHVIYRRGRKNPKLVKDGSREFVSVIGYVLFHKSIAVVVGAFLYSSYPAEARRIVFQASSSDPSIDLLV